MTRKGEDQGYRFGSKANIETDDGYRQELLATERPIPYQLLLMNAIEDVRRAVINAEDGGVSALFALVSLLPERVRNQLGDMEEQIRKYLALKIILVKFFEKRKTYVHPTSKPVDKWIQVGNTRGYLGTEYEQTDKGHYTYKFVPNFELKKQYVTARGAQRDFVCASLVKIIKILDSEGLLWRSRTELVGGET